MGVAAYWRSSHVIRWRIDQEIAERTLVSVGAPFVPEKPADDPLPEGRLRSSFLPEGDAEGTALFLEYKNRWYIVCTRFETLKRARTLAKAARMFERLEMHGLVALERAA